MDINQALSKLKAKSDEGSKGGDDLRQHAIDLLQSSGIEVEDVADLLSDILSSVIKPLFSATQHPSLTASGRKILVPSLPSSNHFTSSAFDEETVPWKNGWTVDLLIFVLSQYQALLLNRGKSPLESQFHLLVPPILNMIDDIDIIYKTQGCRLLRLLCEDITFYRSDILKRTGLTDVFSDALKTNFMLLPTLTPEEDSLRLLEQLYPAFRALVDARFPRDTSSMPKDEEEARLALRPVQNRKPSQSLPKSGSSTPVASKQTEILSRLAEKDSRQALLDLILRHGVLASYAHASDYVKIADFLIREAGLLVAEMGIYSAKYLSQLLPLLRHILSDPFGTAYPPLLLTALATMKVLVRVCWPRIKELWWGECLRACVACWAVATEDQDHGQKFPGQDMWEIQRAMREMTAVLHSLVGDEFKSAKERLLAEDDGLRGLFEEDDRSGN